MGVDDAERRFLEAQGLEHLRQYQVFKNIGNVAGMEMMAVVHRIYDRDGPPVKRIRASLSTEEWPRRYWKCTAHHFQPTPNGLIITCRI